MSVDDAVKAISNSLEDVPYDAEAEDGKPAGPLALLASHAIRAAIRKHAEAAFLRETGDSAPIINPDAQAEQKEEMQSLTAAALSLDMRIAALAATCERVCALELDMGAVEVENQEAAEDSPVDSELYALLRAVSLCQSLRLFPNTSSTIPHAGKAPLAPPPAASAPPSSLDVDIPLSYENGADAEERRQRSLHLRRALASGAFEREEGLEEARDRAVDALLALAAAEREREGRVIGCAPRVGGRVYIRAS